MKTDKELLDYFHQKRNIKKLEELIEELPCSRNVFKKDEINNITNIEETQTILEEIVFPKIKELIPAQDVEEPELKLYNNKLFQKNTNHLLARKILRGTVTGASFMGLTGTTLGIVAGNLISDKHPQAPFHLGIAGGIAGSLVGSILSIPIILLEHKTQNIITGGLAEKKSNTIYIKNNVKYDETIRFLAHETTHQFMAQLTPERLNQMYLSEGLAEAVAFEINRQLPEDVDKSYTLFSERNRLIGGYQDLCDQFKIKEENRKQYDPDMGWLSNKMIKSLRKEEAHYSSGYSAIRLLQLEKGNHVFAQIAGYNSE